MLLNSLIFDNQTASPLRRVKPPSFYRRICSFPSAGSSDPKLVTDKRISAHK
jgi:hypothetical protein